MKHYTIDDISSLPTKQYRKTALTKARRLTAEDHKERNGIIQTLEGTQSFNIGDYLCIGIKDEEWPMSQETFREGKEYFRNTEDNDFALYTTKGIKHAIFVNEQFSVGDNGEPFVSNENGGYIVHNGNPSKSWIVDKDIFEQSYEEIR